MKIIFDHHSPFLLAHGGFQIQIEQRKKALEEIGVEVNIAGLRSNFSAANHRSALHRTSGIA